MTYQQTTVSNFTGAWANFTMMRLLGLITGLLLSIFLTGPAIAQQIKPLEVEPDENGVNMLSGDVKPTLPSLSIPAAPRLRLDRIGDLVPYLEGRYTGVDNSQGSLKVNTSPLSSESFTCYESDCNSSNGNGSIVGSSPVKDQGLFIYVEGSTGKEITFNLQSWWVATGGGSAAYENNFGYHPSRIKYADGEILIITHDTYIDPVYSYYRVHRVKTVKSNTGYEMHFTYASDTGGTGDWHIMTDAKIYKSTDLNTPLASNSYANSNGNYTVTDIDGRTWNCTNCSVQIVAPPMVTQTSMRLPGETADSYAAVGTSITDGTLNKYVVGQVTSNGVAWNYAYVADTATPPMGAPVGVRIKKVTITGPDNFSRIVDIDNTLPSQRIAAITDGLGRRTEFDYDSLGRPIKMTYPEGNSAEVIYDSGGNITEKRSRAKSTSSLADIVETGDYNHYLNCDVLSCFRPNWMKDAKGKQTDFTWNFRGQLETQTAPADADGVRTKTINEYYTGLSRLKKTRLCGVNVGSTAECDTADISVTEYTYWERTFLPRSIVATDPATGEQLRTCYSYDARGNKISETQPRAGLVSCPGSQLDALPSPMPQLPPPPATPPGVPPPPEPPVQPPNCTGQTVC